MASPAPLRIWKRLDLARQPNARGKTGKAPSAVSDLQETSQSVKSLLSVSVSFHAATLSVRPRTAERCRKMQKGMQKGEKAEITTNPRTPWRCRRRFGPKRQQS